MERCFPGREAVDHHVLRVKHEGVSSHVTSTPYDQPSARSEADTSTGDAVGDLEDVARCSVGSGLGKKDHAFVVRKQVINGDLG